jgi:hypothetical protein
MKKRYAALPCFFFLSVVTSGQEVSREACPHKKWLEDPAKFEEILRTAEVVSHEDIGMGVTESVKVTLRHEGETLHAIFKPIRRGRHKGFWESYQAEIAAYRMDRILDLDMVPPTVKRDISIHRGSLQLWVDGCRLFAEAQEASQSPIWMRQYATMRLFDLLIHNDDRNQQNILVDPHPHIILIDHSRAFITGTKIFEKPGKYPVKFDRAIVEKIKSLDLEGLKTQLGSLLSENQLKDVIKRRDLLLQHLDQVIEQRGEASVFFADS